VQQPSQPLDGLLVLAVLLLLTFKLLAVVVALIERNEVEEAVVLVVI
jgi:hypothetical protein